VLGHKLAEILHLLGCLIFTMLLGQCHQRVGEGVFTIWREI
jgi:hypothetical protein